MIFFLIAVLTEAAGSFALTRILFVFLKSNVCHVALEAGGYQLLFLWSIKTGALSQHLIKILNQLFQS